MITIKIDHREDNPQTYLLKDKCEVLTKQHLEIGDYEITDGETSLFIEVKKDNDLFLSIMDGRMESQISDLATVKYSMIAYIGDIYDISQATVPTDEYKGTMHFFEDYPNRIISLKSSLAFETHFAEYRDEHEFQKALLYYAKRLEKGELHHEFRNSAFLRAKKRIKRTTEEDIKISILLPIVKREKIAKLLLEAFDGNVQECLNGLDRDWKDIKGVGKTSTKNLRSLGFIGRERHATDGGDKRDSQTTRGDRTVEKEEIIKEDYISESERSANIEQLFEGQ